MEHNVYSFTIGTFGALVIGFFTMIGMITVIGWIFG